MRQIKRYSFYIFFIVFFCSSNVSASTIVVARGKYRAVLEEQYSEKDARLVADTVTAALTEVGWTPQEIDTECADKDCLAVVAEENTADNAVYVSVDQSSSLYEFKIVTLSGETTTFTKVGPFSLAMEALSKAVKETLGTPPPPEKEATVEEKKTVSQENLPVQESTRTDDRRALKVLFGVGAGLTVSTAIAGTITTVFAFKSKDELQEPDEWETLSAWNTEKDRCDKLAISSWVLWGVTGALAATSVTLGVLAFRKDKGNGKRVELGLPIISNDAAMLVLTGKF